MTALKPGLNSVISPSQGEDRRRSQRVIIRIPVNVEFTASGEKNQAEAETISVNVHGAMLLCARSFEAGAKLEVINKQTRERAAARVTRASRKSGDKFLVPAEFNAPSPSFWQISFPESDWKPLNS